jgi:hypothetical protein
LLLVIESKVGSTPIILVSNIKELTTTTLALMNTKLDKTYSRPLMALVYSCPSGDNFWMGFAKANLKNPVFEAYSPYECQPCLHIKTQREISLRKNLKKVLRFLPPPTT